MKNLKALFFILKEWIIIFSQFLRSQFISSNRKDLEILALRSQLSLYQQQVENKKITKPKCTPVFRQLWVILSKFHTTWKDDIVLVKPETVIRWHKTAFKLYWRKKSKRIGRPKTSSDTINIILEIHNKNPKLSPEKIREMLISMAIIDVPSANTIRKYLPVKNTPPTKQQIQSWKTFLKNQSKNIWAMDYLVVPTLRFKLLYVLIIINHGTRKIEHFAITANPNLEWLKQQIRNATPFDHKPKYLIHDNDPAFICSGFKDFLTSLEIKSKRITPYSPWQNGIAERMNGILRQELLNHIIPINESHLYRLLKEYICKYYNTNRTHQGINCKTPIPLPQYPPTTIVNTKLVATPVLNGLYHTYKKVA